MNESAFFATWAPRLLSVLRMVSAALLMQHGAQKLFGAFGAAGGPGPLPLASQMGVAGVLEFFGGLLLLVGLFTRPVAFILSGMMAVAYFQFHAPGGFWPAVNKGEPAVLNCFVFLYLAAAGGGPWSLDALIARRRGAVRQEGT